MFGRIKPGFDGALARCVQLLDHTASWPPGLPEELSSLGIRCVNATDETKRPRFVEVVRALRAMQDKYPTPAGGPGVAPGYGGYAVIPEGDSQGSGGSGLAGMQSVPYMLELVERLPAHKRRLHLFPSLDKVWLCIPECVCWGVPGAVLAKASGRYVAPVGRQHQPDLFESWLSNEELRSCISRLAFEVSWVPSGDAKITARGNNPVTLNDQILTRNQPMALRIGSEIGFPYSQTGELALFLQLRLAPATLDSATNAAAVAPTAVLDFGEVADRATSSQSWALHCSFVEGLNDEELSDLPGSVTEFKVEGDAPLVIGRQHQAKEFERLLSKASACMSFISRAHVQLEVQNDALLATNISNNPVYVDKKPLSRGESRRLCPNQVISFARLEGSTHVLFISFEAILVDQSAAKTKAFPKPEAERAAGAKMGTEPDAAQIIDNMVNLGDLRKKRRSAKRELPEDAKKTLEYCKKFKQLRNNISASTAKESLMRPVNERGKRVVRCRDFEATQLLNLMPNTGDEARALIPTLEGNPHLEDLVRELGPLKEFDPHIG
eukprot:symbB.v1.2.015559.t1/scaffold1166.1/size134334/10